jgi:23S rRNA (cytidine1920-2'-O)/16S rRNA (cytidine1409-2'-O)-methyltransferase
MKDRLDKIITDKELVSSRSQAKSLIEKGDVKVNGQVVKKAGELIDLEAIIEVMAPLFVGRGAFKLQKALEVFKVEPANRICLDVGASTGGFTEVLLERGAKLVYAIDVGHDQLAAKLRIDKRVVNLEGHNIRDLESLPQLGDLAVMDLSFISITKVSQKLKSLLRPEADLIALIKPQFEAGRDRLPKDGVIKDATLREAILAEVHAHYEQEGWANLGTILSPIEGKNGNVEYLTHFRGQSRSAHSKS